MCKSVSKPKKVCQKLKKYIVMYNKTYFLCSIKLCSPFQGVGGSSDLFLNTAWCCNAKTAQSMNVPDESWIKPLDNYDLYSKVF